MTLEGDREAFGALVERYTRLVHGVILHKVRRPDEVEDLVQDVFCKAYERLSSLREHRKFGPWLARMASNRAQAWLRQRRTRQEYHPDELQILGAADAGERPDQVLEAHETSGIVWEALDRLPPEYRQILLLYHFEGCSQQDIARFLSITLSTVKWRLLRARRLLRRRLEEVFYLEQRQARIGTTRTRDRVLAALPLMAFYRPARPRPEGAEGLRFWVYRRLLPASCAAVLGVLGGLLYEGKADQGWRESAPTSTSGQIMVRLENVPPIIWGREGTGQKRVFPPCSAAHFNRATAKQRNPN